MVRLDGTRALVIGSGGTLAAIEINPLIVHQASAIAVDALVEGKSDH